MTKGLTLFNKAKRRFMTWKVLNHFWIVVVYNVSIIVLLVGYLSYSENKH